MTMPNLGKKHTCQSCEARFFDLNKNPALCPKCGGKNKILKPKTRRAAPPVPKAASVKTPEVEAVAEAPKAEETATEPDFGDDDAPQEEGNEADEEADELKAELEDEQDDSLMEDTSEMSDHKDDLSEVLEHVDDGNVDK